jgi:transmembrane sensor
VLPGWFDRDERLRRHAARWLARLLSSPSPRAERAFRRWYDADPRHAQVFDRISSRYDQAALLRLSRVARPTLRPTIRQTLPPRYALAAVIAFALMVPAAIVVAGWRGMGPLKQTDALLLSTAVGEIRQVQLRDGTVLTLDTASEVEIKLGWTERRASIRRGRARIAIAKDPRPFVAATRQISAMSKNAVIDVEQTGDESDVRVISGGAAVRLADRPDVAAAELGAAQALSSSAARPIQEYPWRSAQPDWTHGFLQFDATPLSDAVAQANRYSSKRITLAPGLGSRAVTGAFRVGDPLQFARALSVVFDLDIKRLPSGDLLLSPRGGPAA